MRGPYVDLVNAQMAHDVIGPEVLVAAGRTADRLMLAGAEAVVLVGSHANGTADDVSDIDIVAVGDGPVHETGWWDGRLLVVNWRTAGETRSAFVTPDLAGIAVPAWRGSYLLRDPSGVAARLREEALRWSWTDELHAACDRWVGDQLVYLTEDVLRMAACLRRGAPALAAASAPFVAVQLTTVMAVHRRMELRSVNDAWAMTARAEGPQWTSLRDGALALGHEPLRARVGAAVGLFRSTVERTSPVLDGAQLATATATADRALGLL